MDLTVQIDTSKLNIRVAVILKTHDGYIFCESKQGYYFPVGGRVKINESSLEAAYREVQEELEYDMKTLTLCSVLENFFIHDETNIKVHEFCFIYKCDDIISIELPEFFVELTEQEILEKDIRPILIKDIIAQTPSEIIHHISK